MRRHVRTLGHVAHVAEVAVVHYLPEHFPVDTVDLARGRLVNCIEQRGKGLAKIEAAAASVADVEHPLELFRQSGFVVESGIAPVDRVARGSLEAAFFVAGNG